MIRKQLLKQRINLQKNTPLFQQWTTQKHIEVEKKHGTNMYGPVENIVIKEGKGTFVWDVDNNKYTDFIMGISSTNQGHCHPKLIQALNQQANTIYSTSRSVYNNQLSQTQQYLHEVFGYDKACLMSTGYEACDTAVKFARRWAYNVKGVEDGCAEIIFPEGNFWGRGIAACGASDDPLRYNKFGPFDGLGFSRVKFDDIEALEEKFKNNKNISAYMFEPILGEKGIIIPHDNYLQQVRQLCTKYQVLMICDEIQAGLGRAGSLLSHHYYGVRPDIITMGKSVSGGIYPVSIVLADNEVMDQIKPGEHGSTWAGNQMASAIARTGIQILLEENMIENSRILGEKMLKSFKQVFEGNSLVKDVRGRGLWVAVEFVNADVATKFSNTLPKYGILAKNNRENMRFAPALNITEIELNEAIKKIEECLQQF